MKTARLKGISSLIGVAFCMGFAGAAQAQDGADTGEGTDIIVTATKRAENLQNVPISVSAITGDSLSKSRVTQADELVTKVPNLQLTSTVGDNTPIFALRGVSMSDYSLNQASPVATYYDEVYKGNFAFLGVALFDLERVEVLRGPQGTLYGKNTTGGAVNLISRTAKLGETEGYFNLGYGNYDRIDVNGAINLPLGDKAALRVAGTLSRADGWFKNVLPGQPDLASVREYGVRASLLFEPSDGVRFVLRAATSYQNPRNYGIYAQPEAINRPGLKKREIAANVTDRRRARTYAVSLTGNFDVSDTLTVTSITSWDKGRLNFYEDTDGQPNQLLEIPYKDRATQFAQDLRLTSDFDGPFNFILGAYYNREKVFNETTFEIGKDIDSDGLPGVTDADCAIGFPVGCLFDNSFDQLKKSRAIYTDMSMELSEALKLRGGLRYTHDTGDQTNFRSDAFGPNGVLVTNLIPPSALAYKTNNLSGKIGLDFKLADRDLIYANYSRGYRARSFNAQAFFDPSELSVAKPEQVDAFELGLKSQFADRRVTLNMAAFYYKYRNQQFINIDPVLATQTLENIPRSRIMGGEAELTARVNDALTLRAGLGLLDTKIQNGIVSGVNVQGNRLSNAPSVTFSGGIDATVIDNGSGKFSLHGDLAYSSSQYFEVLNIPRLKQGSYALLSGHIDWESANGRWNASIWGKNLTNKFYFTSRVDLLAGNTLVIKPAPTTPLTTLRLGEICNEIFPAGVVNIVTDQNDLGGVLTTHPDVAKISFTGSTETGKKVMASAASSIKRITLELGGNDAAIVMPDADPKEVAPGLFGAATMNAGQVCLAVKRVYAHESHYDELCDELAKLADAAIVDDGLKQGAQIGPLQNRMQYEKVKGFLEDARANGNIIAGGQVEDRPGFFIRPTIVRDVEDGTMIVDEEQFGPILPVIKYSDPEQALERANASPWGLGGSVWGKDRDRAYELACEMESGTVWINKHLDFGPNIPFGGAKQSGIGVEFAEEGLHEFTQIQVINEAR